MKGIGSASGISIGKAIVRKELEPEITKKIVSDCSMEIQKLNTAIEKSRAEIAKLYEKTKTEIGDAEADIFQAHEMILDDPELWGEVKNKISEAKANAEWAVKEVSCRYMEMFRNMENEYLKERAADIQDVTGRVVRNLTGAEAVDLSRLEEDGILVAEDLAPSDTAQMDKEKVIGFITEKGGRTGHSSIMARALEIPAVVGVGKEIEKIHTGDIIVMDGTEGIVYVNPDPETIRKYADKKKENEELKEELKQYVGRESRTKDGFRVELFANIGVPDDVDGVLSNDGEGIGLFRTEFLYMSKDRLPTEDEQFEVYRTVAERMGGKPVIIRTLDVGGDKGLPYMDLPEEMNPFLGYRAIRICLDRTEIFKTQLRALLRAGAYGTIKIMFPMISAVEELRKAKEILKQAKKELESENIGYCRDMEVGMMIEIPAAAVISDLFAREADFFSIGTNDLIQYTAAVDRGNKNIAHLYQPFHPAVLRLIRTVIENGHKAGIRVGMCGEAAGDPRMIPLLIGMGLDEFSMSPSSILKARRIISNTTKGEIESKVCELLDRALAEEILKEL